MLSFAPFSSSLAKVQQSTSCKLCTKLENICQCTRWWIPKLKKRYAPLHLEHFCTPRYCSPLVGSKELQIRTGGRNDKRKRCVWQTCPSHIKNSWAPACTLNRCTCEAIIFYSLEQIYAFCNIEQLGTRFHKNNCWVLENALILSRML